MARRYKLSPVPAPSPASPLAQTDEPVYNLEINRQHVYHVGQPGTLVHNSCVGIVPTRTTVRDIPTYKSGNFDEWFDKQSPQQLEEYWKDISLRNKIKDGLLGPGGEHEYLMRPTAPRWKQWGITAGELREKYSVALDELDKVPKFTHSRGTRGSLEPGLTRAHNELSRHQIVSLSSKRTSFHGQTSGSRTVSKIYRQHFDNERMSMSSFECEGKVSIWVFLKTEDPEDAEKDVLIEFCGVDYYDSDFQEGMSCIEPAPLKSILGDLSYSDSFIDAALTAARKQGIEEVFGVLAQFNFDYDKRKDGRPISDDPRFVGVFDWHD